MNVTLEQLRQDLFDLWKSTGHQFPTDQLRSLCKSTDCEYDELLCLLAEALVERSFLEGGIKVASRMSEEWAEEQIAILTQVAQEACRTRQPDIAEHAIGRAVQSIPSVSGKVEKIGSAVVVGRTLLQLERGRQGVSLVEEALRSNVAAGPGDRLRSVDESVEISNAARFFQDSGCNWKAIRTALSVPVLSKRIKLLGELARRIHAQRSNDAET